MQPLPHVLWIGGPAGSGKTTIAKRLARRYGLRWYSCDAQTWRHRDRAVAAQNPAALRFEAMTPEERATATPGELLEMSLHPERGPMIVDDLRELPTAPLVVAEGSTLPPFVVSTGIAAPDRAVWLLPTAGFQRARLEERNVPESVRRSLNEAYRKGAAAIAREVAEHGAPSLVVDGSRDLDEMTAAVEERFRRALAEGPRADTREERRALIREGNEAILAQCLGYLARPWASGDAESFMRAFHCECDDPGCEGVVELTVAVASRLIDAGSGPLLAHAAGGAAARSSSTPA